VSGLTKLCQALFNEGTQFLPTIEKKENSIKAHASQKVKINKPQGLPLECIQEPQATFPLLHDIEHIHRMQNIVSKITPQLFNNWLLLQQQTELLKGQIELLKNNTGMSKSSLKPYKLQSRHINIAQYIHQTKKDEERLMEWKVNKICNPMEVMKHGISINCTKILH